MSYKAMAHTERARSMQAPTCRARFGGKARKGGYVHKHGVPTVEEAAAKYEHGSVARYILAKCRCLPCGFAASEYNRKLREAKRGPWRLLRAEEKKRWIVAHEDGSHRHGPYRYDEARRVYTKLCKASRKPASTDLVSATRVRRHLQMLSDGGMGVKSIRKASGVAASVLDRLRRGMILRTRRSTEAKILAVQLAADRLVGRDIPGGPTFAMLDALIAVGYRKGWIALQLGAKHPCLQIGKASGRGVVRADKARLVKALFDRLWQTDARLREHVDPEGERARAEAAANEAATRASRDKLARALKSWDPDEFATRFARLGEVR